MNDLILRTSFHIIFTTPYQALAFRSSFVSPTHTHSTPVSAIFNFISLSNGKHFCTPAKLMNINYRLISARCSYRARVPGNIPADTMIRVEAIRCVVAESENYCWYNMQVKAGDSSSLWSAAVSGRQLAVSFFSSSSSPHLAQKMSPRAWVTEADISNAKFSFGRSVIAIHAICMFYP